VTLPLALPLASLQGQGVCGLLLRSPHSILFRLLLILRGLRTRLLVEQTGTGCGSHQLWLKPRRLAAERIRIRRLAAERTRIRRWQRLVLKLHMHL
jgi:hypothetical protein